MGLRRSVSVDRSLFWGSCKNKPMNSSVSPNASIRASRDPGLVPVLASNWGQGSRKSADPTRWRSTRHQGPVAPFPLRFLIDSMESETEVSDRIKVLHQQALREPDPFSSFGLWWSCINAWLRFESANKSDKDMIDWLKESSIEGSRLRRCYEAEYASDEFKKQLKALADMSPIKHSLANNSAVTITSIEDFDGVIEGIYQVRCRLAHGHMSPRETENLQLVMICGRIFHKWIGCLATSFK